MVLGEAIQQNLSKDRKPKDMWALVQKLLPEKEKQAAPDDPESEFEEGRWWPAPSD